MLIWIQHQHTTSNRAYQLYREREKKWMWRLYRLSKALITTKKVSYTSLTLFIMRSYWKHGVWSDLFIPNHEFDDFLHDLLESVHDSSVIGEVVVPGGEGKSTLIHVDHVLGRVLVVLTNRPCEQTSTWIQLQWKIDRYYLLIRLLHTLKVVACREWNEPKNGLTVLWNISSLIWKDVSLKFAKSSCCWVFLTASPSADAVKAAGGSRRLQVPMCFRMRSKRGLPSKLSMFPGWSRHES